MFIIIIVELFLRHRNQEMRSTNRIVLTFHLDGGTDIATGSTGADRLLSERSESGAGRRGVCRSTRDGEEDSDGGKLHFDNVYVFRMVTKRKKGKKGRFYYERMMTIKQRTEARLLVRTSVCR
jgi:hypothetical protein